MVTSIQLIRRNDEDPNRVFVNGTELTPAASLLIRSHSPDGFDWGYHGSGPAQTALAICLHLFGPHVAQNVYQSFKMEHVSAWKEEGCYTVDISGFYQQFVEPYMPDYMAEWMDFVLNQIMSATAHKSYLVTDIIDHTKWSVSFRVKDGLTQLQSICEPLGYTLIKLDGTWYVKASFPLTDTMVGLVINRSADMFSAAVGQFTDVLGTAAKNISKIA